MKRSGGLTIVEAVIALAVIGVALAAIVPVFTNYAGVNQRSDVRTGAVAAAQEVLESLRQQDFSSWPANGAVVTAGSGGRDYGVVVNYCLQGQDGVKPDAPCLSEGQIRHVLLEAKYGGEVRYELETAYTAVH